jgi:histidinol dehydrogenase
LATGGGRAILAAMSLLPVFEHDDPALAPRFDRSTTFAREVEDAVHAIVADVRTRGDEAVRAYTERFDGRGPGPDGSYEVTPPSARGAVRWRRRCAARSSTRPSASAGSTPTSARTTSRSSATASGWACAPQPLARVGLYVPGGTARYPSSVLMTAIPAKVAGVPEVIMVTPGASAETLVAAEIAGVDRVFELGGAQAVAALAYGTETVPRVDKIVGPGNQWVAAAKRLVFGQVDIDSVAGPSEVLIIADASANPAWVAADLLAQAEHDVEARAILVTTARGLPTAVERELEAQLIDLPRARIARTALERWGAAILVRDLEQAIAVANRYAPEHLELDVEEPRALVPRLRTAGAIFVGKWAAEAAGDYVAGANHVLPTGGAARYASPLGVYDFVRRTSIVEYDEAAACADAAVIATLAAVEGLDAHGRSATIRARGGRS